MKNNRCVRLSLLFVCLAWMGMANAEIYKWKDKDGNIHFGDKPPEVKGVDKMNVNSAALRASPAQLVRSNTKKVVTMKPFHVDGAQVRRVKLEKVVLSLDGDLGGDVVIGKNYTTCDRETEQGARPAVKGVVYGPDKTILAKDKGILRSDSYDRQFAKSFQDHNYKVITPSEELFDVGHQEEPDLLVGAIVKELAMNMCRYWSGGLAADTVAVASYVKVGWQVYDPLNKEVVYETITEGSDERVVSNGKPEEIKQADARSFGNATTNLLAQPEFVKLLLSRATSTKKVDSSEISASVSVDYGSGTGDFVAQVETLKSGTVTVRTANGHGSGLIVDPAGYVVTNAHVVGGSSNVLVLIGGRKYRADVVMEDAQRDVALLRIGEAGELTSLTISENAIRTGETIYVIGTPLDENLSHTVTRGIISAERVINGKRYFQTDAAVNPGNSGGPVFDKNGEVVGVTVAGIFTKDGGSLNINFLIPIEEALSSLGI